METAGFEGGLLGEYGVTENVRLIRKNWIGWHGGEKSF